MIKPIIKLVWPVIFLAGTVVLIIGFAYLPWILPTHFIEMRFGWPEEMAVVFRSGQKVSMIIVGTCLFASYLRTPSQGAKGERESRVDQTLRD